MTTNQLNTAQKDHRQTDGRFGAFQHGVSDEVHLEVVSEQTDLSKVQCGQCDSDDIVQEGLCGECRIDLLCSDCGSRNDDGDGSDGLCGNCADQATCTACDEEPADRNSTDMRCADCKRDGYFPSREDDNTVCVFELGVEGDGDEEISVDIDRVGRDLYSLYNTETNEQIVASFTYDGDPEDHDNLEHAAKLAFAEDRARDAELLRQAMSVPAHDLSWFAEEDKALPRALYSAGLEGSLEPYNGDYPGLEDGALRYWREDLSREIFIGTTGDGTTLVGVDIELGDPAPIESNLGADPSTENILEAVRDVEARLASQ